MIEYFREWLQESVTHVTQAQNAGLQNNGCEINAVTHVTHVTHENTKPREVVPEDSSPLNVAGENMAQIILEGYTGYTGYKPDSEATSGVTHADACRVTRVTNVELDATNSWEWIVERSAILEYEARLPRQVADSLAFTQWFNCFVGSGRP
jgi:hypothetical protein